MLRVHVFVKTTYLLKRFAMCWLVALSLLTSNTALALGDASYISFKANGGVRLADEERLAGLLIDSNDFKGLQRAAGDLQTDIQRVTGKLPTLHSQLKDASRHAVIIGSVGRSGLIQLLVEQNKLNVADIEGQWEAYKLVVVDKPFPNIEKALVIVGSDMRGAIFGVYDLSQQIGVSPWYWWADVPVQPQSKLYVRGDTQIVEQPKVQYRGIFLNDEAPALTNWVHANYGNYNSQFYTQVFELLLRLKANFLWPAMWNNSFSVDDPLNPVLANEYGIVMSTSHHEPMMRAHKEWHGMGRWDFTTNADALKQFWREGVERNSPYENIITMAMRGDGDEAMSEDANVELLEQIVDAQRNIIAEVFEPKGKQVTEVPQVWCLYKEVQDYYEKGMRVPDDITLLWADDNWGNIRRLPTAQERKRSGGAGVYYHFDYVGGPRSYRWINTTPLAKIWEQMHLAYQYEANKIWIVNVGDLKPMEVPMEYFLEMAWNPEQWPKERITQFGELWAEREFGPAYAKEIAQLVQDYTQHNGRRKPELQDANTYSLLNYDEAARIEQQLTDMESRAETLFNKIPANQRDAYYQLVMHPVLASATVTKMYIAQARNQLYAKQGRPSANSYGQQVKELFEKDAALTKRYHSINNGKWNHFMSQPHIGYTNWNNPEDNIMPVVSVVSKGNNADMGVAVEGMEPAWPMQDAAYALPTFTRYGKQTKNLTVFNKGVKPLKFSVSTGAVWLKVSASSGEITHQEMQIQVSVDWAKLPLGSHESNVTIKGPSWVAANIKVTANKPAKVKPLKKLTGFVEADGYISFDAAAATHSKAVDGFEWQEIPAHGRTHSSMSVYPIRDASFTAPANASANTAPQMHYTITLLTAGEVTVEGLLAPTWPIHPERGLRYAIAFDDQPPQIVDVLAGNSHEVWQESVRTGVRRASSKHTLTAGTHTMKVWAIDPAVTVQKWIIDTGELKPSYLGPTPSPKGGKH